MASTDSFIADATGKPRTEPTLDLSALPVVDVSRDPAFADATLVPAETNSLDGAVAEIGRQLQAALPEAKIVSMPRREQPKRGLLSRFIPFGRRGRGYEELTGTPIPPPTPEQRARMQETINKFGEALAEGMGKEPTLNGKTGDAEHDAFTADLRLAYMKTTFENTRTKLSQDESSLSDDMNGWKPTGFGGTKFNAHDPEIQAQKTAFFADRVEAIRARKEELRHIQQEIGIPLTARQKLDAYWDDYTANLRASIAAERAEAARLEAEQRAREERLETARTGYGTAAKLARTLNSGFFGAVGKAKALFASEHGIAKAAVEAATASYDLATKAVQKAVKDLRAQKIDRASYDTANDAFLAAGETEAAAKTTFVGLVLENFLPTRPDQLDEARKYLTAAKVELLAAEKALGITRAAERDENGVRIARIKPETAVTATLPMDEVLAALNPRLTPASGAKQPKRPSRTRKSANGAANGAASGAGNDSLAHH